MSTIRICKVVVDNFLTIKHASVDFENRGLIGVIGPNGAGKSALIVEAPCYGLFGVSERYGNKRDQLVNRFVGKDMHVGVELDVDGMNVKVETYRKHHKYKDDVFLFIDGKDKRGNSNDQTWDKITKILDMDYTSFTNAVVFSQSLAQYFSSLSDAYQKEIVERLLGITWIPQVYEIAKSDKNDCLSKLSDVENSYKEQLEKIEELEGELTEYRNKFEEFEEEKVKRIKELEVQFEELIDTSKLDKKIRSLESRKLSIEEDSKSIECELRETEKKVISFGTEIKLKEKEISRIDYRLKIIGDEVGNICEFCGRKITKDSVVSYSDHLKADRLEFVKEKEGFSAELDKITFIKSNLEKNLEDCENKIEVYNEDLKNLKNNLDSDKIKNARAEERNNALKTTIGEIRKSINIYRDIVEKLEIEMKQVKETAEGYKKEYNGLEVEIEYHRFWEEGFSNRGLKSFIIESVIPQMNQYANLYSSVLGGKYNISFSTQKQLKRGELREKFYVDVVNRFGSELYEGNSNGERRAIDSIVMFVLGDLAASRSNKRFSMLILDDVFEKLDEEICDSIISALKMMLTGSASLPQRESVFVLTHLEYFTSKFENRIYVERKHGETTYREG